jgi:hypothetical protein
MGFPPFAEYVAFMDRLLAGRRDIVDALERQLFSSRGKAYARSGDRESVGDIVDACFFGTPTHARDLSRLNAQLIAAHRADGYEPFQDGYSRDLDPVELVLRGCHYWDHDRWPGRNGRLLYAHALFTAFILRKLEQLSLRVWDPSTTLGASPSTALGTTDGNEDAAERLQQVQRLLDALNRDESPSTVPLVRDARWLIQTAQGPLTTHLKPYFITADKVSGSFSVDDRLEIHKAGVVLAGGHLRSQLRHRSWQTGRPFDDPLVVAMTRSSSSMDIALLVSDLVPLLHAYLEACARLDGRERTRLADAILQSLSADPELLLTRLDLLAPSTLIEDLFVDRNGTGPASYTTMGEAHRDRVANYVELIGRAAESLQQDSLAFHPARAPYSPLGIVYGFCADLFSNMVLSTLRSPTSPNLTLEDMFVSSDRLEEKHARANEWDRLPKCEGERAPFEHSTEWATQIFERMSAALDARAARPAEPNASQFGKSQLYVVPRGVDVDSIADGLMPPGIVSAQEHCLTSDIARARATGATALPAGKIAADRAEGRFLASLLSEGEWFGVSKVPLTLFMSQGKDALLADVPSAVIDVLRMTCPELVVVISPLSTGYSRR